MQIYDVDIVSSQPFTISWDSDKGFGIFSFSKQGDTMLIDNECMSKDTIKAVLCKLVEDAELVDGEE